MYLDNYFQNYRENDPSTHINWYNILKSFDSDFSFFKATSSMYYSFCCHFAVFPVYEKLMKKSNKRTIKIFIRSIILDISIFIVVGLAGYLTQPKDPPQIILEREKIGDTDYFMILARLLVVLMFLAKVPASYTCMRISLFQMIWGTTEITDKR